MNKMDTDMLRHELQGLVDNHTPQYEVERIARRAIQFMDQEVRPEARKDKYAELQSLLNAAKTIVDSLKAEKG